MILACFINLPGYLRDMIKLRLFANDRYQHLNSKYDNIWTSFI